jgi:hypothetical protein
METEESINKKIISLLRILHLYLHELEIIQERKNRDEQVSMSDRVELVLRDSSGNVKTKLNN